MPDAALFLFLAERLRAIPRQRRDLQRDVVIAVGGGKGGVGGSTMTKALSLIAREEQLPVEIVIHPHSNARWGIEELRASGVTANVLLGPDPSSAFEEFLGSRSGMPSLLFLDLPKGFFVGAAQPVIDHIDLCVLPCNFASVADVWATEAAVLAIESKSPRPVLPVNLSPTLDLHFVKSESDAVDLMARGYPMSIPNYADGCVRPVLSPVYKRLLEFSNSDARARYWHLLSHILDIFSINLERLPVSGDDADFFDLVDSLN